MFVRILVQETYARVFKEYLYKRWSELNTCTYIAIILLNKPRCFSFCIEGNKGKAHANILICPGISANDLQFLNGSENTVWIFSPGLHIRVMTVLIFLLTPQLFPFEYVSWIFSPTFLGEDTNVPRFLLLFCLSVKTVNTSFLFPWNEVKFKLLWEY